MHYQPADGVHTCTCTYVLVKIMGRVTECEVNSSSYHGCVQSILYIALQCTQMTQNGKAIIHVHVPRFNISVYNLYIAHTMYIHTCTCVYFNNNIPLGKIRFQHHQ